MPSNFRYFAEAECGQVFCHPPVLITNTMACCEISTRPQACCHGSTREDSLKFRFELNRCRVTTSAGPQGGSTFNFIPQLAATTSPVCCSSTKLMSSLGPYLIGGIEGLVEFLVATAMDAPNVTSRSWAVKLIGPFHVCDVLVKQNICPNLVQRLRFKSSAVVLIDDEEVATTPARLLGGLVGLWIATQLEFLRNDYPI